MTTPNSAHSPTAILISFIIWIILVGLTIFAYYVGQEGLEVMDALILLLGGALIKGQLVISHFMGMKDAPRGWASIPTIWLLIVLGGISVAFLQ